MAAAPAAAAMHGFLFADLRGYTSYVDANGDRAAAQLLERYRTLVRAEVAAFRGAEIKTEGDSFYVVFDSASAAVRCGLAVLTAARTTTDEVIAVGVGVHAGETVETAEGYVGLAVNIAARLCSQAKAGELVVSETVRALTRSSLEVGFEPLGSRRLKGLEEPMAIFRVVPGGSGGARGSRARRGGRYRRHPWLTGIGAVAVIVVLGVVGVAVRPGGGPAPTAPPSALPGAAAAATTPSTTTPGAVEGRAALTSDERTLLARIPTDFQPSSAVRHHRLGSARAWETPSASGGHARVDSAASNRCADVARGVMRPRWSSPCCLTSRRRGPTVPRARAAGP